MYSISYLRRQVDALQRKLKPVLAILKLRNLAMQFCDEFDQALLSEDSHKRDLTGICMMFPPRVGQAGFRLDKGQDLVRYFLGCIQNRTGPEPREVVFTLIPWARRGPLLRPYLWERPNAA